MSRFPVDRIILSHSSQSTVRSCDRKFEFSQMYGDWEGSRDESFAAEVGKALHAAAQNYLIYRDEVKANYTLLTKFPHEMEYAGPGNSTRSLEACYATLEAIINSPIMNQYDLTHIKLKDRAVPAVEVPFAIKIIGAPTDLELWFIGYVDAFLFDRVDDHRAFDVKTTRQWVNDYSARYEFDEQTIPYGIILEHVLGRKIDQFTTSYLVAFIDLLEPKVSKYDFVKSREHIEDWLRSLCETFDRIIMHRNKGWFPRATDGSVCFSFQRPCHFLEYCSYRNPETIMKILDPHPRKGLFHDGEEPWITAELQYVSS